jgi:hypothetical protein
MDAAADKAWFRAHPGIRERTRAVSPLEQAAFDLPAETVVNVRRRADGSQVRSFYMLATPSGVNATNLRPSQSGENPGGESSPPGSGS